MNKLEQFRPNESMESYENKLADLDTRVNHATKTLLKSGIALLEAQVRELRRTVEARDKSGTGRLGG